MLDLLEEALKSDGFTVQRIDGRCSLQERDSALRQFNEDPGCTIMLASIGSAGEGYVEEHFCYSRATYLTPSSNHCLLR